MELEHGLTRLDFRYVTRLTTHHVIILKLARGLDWVKYTVVDDGVDSELKKKKEKLKCQRMISTHLISP